MRFNPLFNRDAYVRLSHLLFSVGDRHWHDKTRFFLPNQPSLTNHLGCINKLPNPLLHFTLSFFLCLSYLILLPFLFSKWKSSLIYYAFSCSLLCSFTEERLQLSKPKMDQRNGDTFKSDPVSHCFKFTNLNSLGHTKW